MINQNWVFGHGAGLDFSNANTSTAPVPISGFAMNTNEGCASISDANGTLLFYTNGENVWDSTHTIRATGLQGHSSSSQSCVIVPDPNNPDQYYIFTIDGSHNFIPPYHHFNGILINVSTWNTTPLASLMTLPSTTGLSPAERITAIPGDNCGDHWVICCVQRATDTNRPALNGQGVFRVFKVTTSGVSFIGDTDLPQGQNLQEWGCIKVSPLGDKIAVTTGDRLANVLIYPFNRTSGLIDIAGEINIPRPTTPTGSPLGSSFGVEFSPDGQLLYFGDRSRSDNYIFQVDLNASVPTASHLVTINNINPRIPMLGALQLGVDGRIYFALNGTNQLGAILNPNVIGPACDIRLNYITLNQGSSSAYGLPNLVVACPKDPDIPCDCDCSCTGCNEDADVQNKELIDRAQSKFNTVPANENLDQTPPFQDDCNNNTVVTTGTDFTPSFYFHWGDGTKDQIEEHDTEVFYLTVCNRFEDVRYMGLRITSVTLVPDIEDLNRIHIVPDRFISLDCLEPCSCQTREFALLTRGNDIAGAYTLEVDYCYEGLALTSSSGSGTATFPVEITKD